MDDQPALPPSQQPKRFFDVSPPKDFRPSATSRPVIVSNRPQQADPMMAPAAPTPPAPGEPAHDGPETAEQMMQEEYDEIAHELPGDTTLHLPATTVQPASSEQPVVITTPAVGQAVVAHHTPPVAMGKKLVILVIAIVIAALLAFLVVKLLHHS
jgi:hypothetical protein